MKTSKNIKKLSAAVITAILAAGLTVSAFAAPGQGNDGGFGGNGGRGGQGMLPPTQNTEEGERPELPEFEEGERPELPEFEEGERPELPELEEGEMPELPEGEELPEPPSDENGGQDGVMNQRMGGRGGHPGQGGMGPKSGMINPEALAETIATVEDEETQTALSDLLAAYEEALDAEKEALDNKDSEEEDIDIESLRSAVMEAKDALVSAMEEAGLEIELPDLPQNMEGERPELNDSDEERENLPELKEGQKRENRGEKAQITDDTEDETETAAQDSTDVKQGKKGLFSRVKDAVSNFFGKFKK